jgi:putative ABC transport system permease protein
MYLVVGQGIGLTIAGLVLGGVAALLLTRFIQAWLFEVSSGDWIAFGSSSAALLAAAVVACYLPARRAVRADVVAVLRSQ